MITDTDIKRDVEAALRWNPDIDATDIGVAVKDGVVALTGFVRSYGQKYEAEREAKKVKGVRGLANDIEVKLPALKEHSDPEIARDAADALKRELPYSSEHIKVTVRNGLITLEGDVEWKFQSERAEAAVRRIEGLKGVINLVQIKPRTSPAEVKSRIEDALKRSAALDAQRITALVMRFALPASLFVATATTERGKMLAESSLFLLLGITMIVFYGLWYLLQLRAKASHGEAAVQALTVALPNYAAAGLPIVLAVIGPAAIVHVAVAIAAGSILLSPITLFILELSRTGPDTARAGSSGRLRKAMIDAVAKPIVIAPVLGVLVSLSGLHLDVLVTSSLQLIGQAAGGVALFLTGLVLSAQPFQFDRRVVLATILSNIAQPLFVFGLTRLIPTPPDIAAVAILLAALPSGFFGILFGINYDVASKEAGSMVIASTICSMVTLGVAILLLYPQ